MDPRLIEPKPVPLSERRTHAREPIQRLCKILHPPSGRYLPARTSNVSAGGALLEVSGPRPLTPGEEVRLVVAWHPIGVLDSGDMIRARVVRIAAAETGRQMVAVRFGSERSDGVTKRQSDAG